MIMVRTNPVSRDTSVPAAITALDFSRPDARPPDFFAAGAGAGAEGCAVAGAGSGAA